MPTQQPIPISHQFQPFHHTSSLTGPIAPTTTPPIPSNKRPTINIPAMESQCPTQAPRCADPTINGTSAERSPDYCNNATKEHCYSSSISIRQRSYEENPKNISNPIAGAQYSEEGSGGMVKLCRISQSRAIVDQPMAMLFLTYLFARRAIAACSIVRN
jgi:hypothetical protein